jgi:hypothetical protein
MSILLTSIFAFTFFVIACGGVYWLWRRFECWGGNSAGLGITYGIALPDLFLFGISFLLFSNAFFRINNIFIYIIGGMFVLLANFPSFLIAYGFNRKLAYIPAVLFNVGVFASYFFFGSSVNLVITAVGIVLSTILGGQILKYTK